jgi:hypothetical protein
MNRRTTPLVLRTPVRERALASAAFAVLGVLSLTPQVLPLAHIGVPLAVHAGCGGLTVLCVLVCAHTLRGGYIRVDDARVTIRRHRMHRIVDRTEITDVLLGQGPGFDPGKVVPAIVLRSGQTLKLAEFASPRHQHARNARNSLAGVTVTQLRAALFPAVTTTESDAA